MSRFENRLYRFCLVITFALLFGWLAGCAPQEHKIPTVGILVGGSGFMDSAEGFMVAMKELGYEEGVDIQYDLQNVAVNSEKMEEVCRDFVSSKIDVIVTASHGATVAAKKITSGTGIPVVFAVAVADHTLVDSISRPGGNITGVRFPLSDLALKAFESLLMIKPGTRRILMIYQTDYPPAVKTLSTMRPFAQSKGVALEEVPVDDLDALKDFFDAHGHNDLKVDAMQTLPEPLCYSAEGWRMMKTFARSNRIPIVGDVEPFIKDGAVLAISPSNYEMGKMAAPLVKKVLEGTPAGTIPIVTPKLQLTINYRLAKELSLTVPDHLLIQAVEIIK